MCFSAPTTTLSPVFGAISRRHDPNAAATRRHPNSTTAPNQTNLNQKETILSELNRIPGATYPAPNEHHFELAKLKSIAGGPDYSSAHGGCVVGERMIVALMRMPAGTLSEPHSHPNEQWVFQIEGTSLNFIGDQEVEAKPGSLIYIPSNVVHHGRVTSSEDSVFFTVKDTSHGLYGIKK
jgi:quercetin dioxygenase-like cupin family protein